VGWEARNDGWVDGVLEDIPEFGLLLTGLLFLVRTTISREYIHWTDIGGLYDIHFDDFMGI